jgi:hypothetical protein
MDRSGDDNKAETTYWRGMYAIAFVLGVLAPLVVIIAVGIFTEEKAWRFQYTNGYQTVGLREGPLLLLALAWSAATLITIVSISSSAWLVLSTATRLGIDRTVGYVRSVFVLAFLHGVLIPLAAIVAAGVTSVGVPPGISAESMWVLALIWCGMIATSIAGIVSAAWLVKSAGAKLGSPRYRPHTELFQPNDYRARVAADDRL